MQTENNIPQQGPSSTSNPTQVSLLFCDHLSHENSHQAFSNEICFEKPVKVQQIRIAKGGSLITPKFKATVTTSLTQTESIKSLEIFAKDLDNPKSRYETLVFSSNLKELYNQDVIFTINKDVITNHLILRGIFKQVTILIYGDIIEEREELIEDVPLGSLREDIENLQKFTRHEEEGHTFEPSQNVQTMINYFKSINQVIRTPNISINTDNIRPRLLFEEKDAKLRTNEDYIKIIESYTKELNKVLSGNVVEQTSKYLQYIDQLSTQIDEYLKQNDGHIRLPADFNDNPTIFHQIPLSVVRICLNTFFQQYDDLTEVYHGLKLAKSFLSSYDHAYDFIQGDGLEKIYQIILEKDGYTSPFLKILALEVINLCLNYDFACERFVSLDITKLEGFIDQSQTESIKKDKEKEKDRERDRDKEKERDSRRDRDRDRDDSKDRLQKKKSKVSASRSRSRSKSSKKSKKRKHKDRKSKKDRSRSHSRSRSKSHSKKKVSKHKKKRDSDSTSESRSPSRPRKSSRSKEAPTIEMRVYTGYQKVLNQLNKSENTKVNFAIRQVLHKAVLYCYLRDLERLTKTELIPEINKLKELDAFGLEISFKERNMRVTHLNEIVDSISSLLRNLLPIFVSQLLFNGRMVSGELKFDECVAKPFLKDKLQGIGIMSHLVTILKHDNFVVSHGMSILFKRINLIPSMALCMSSDYVIKSPHFEELFNNIRNIFITLLGAKGGACILGKYPEHLKILLGVLEYLQKDLKKYELELPENAKIFNEDNMFGIFDNCQNFEMNILNSFKETVIEPSPLITKRMIRIGIFARQLSATLKYIVHAINAVDLICVRQMADNYDEVMIINLSQLAHISNKNRISNHALRSLMINEPYMQLMITVMTAKTTQEVVDKIGEISLASEIIYQVLRYDTGELSLLWGESLNKTIPPISKIIKDEKNHNYFKDEVELKNSVALLENYMEPIFTYSIISDKDDGIMLLLIEFNKKCRYQGPPKLGMQQRNTLNHKHDSYGLPAFADEANFLRDDIKYFGNGSTPNSPIIYMESALNILNIMASYYNNILIHYLEKDIFSGISMISNSLCLIVEKFLANDVLRPFTHKILSLKTSYFNTYLRTLTKSLFLIYQRMEYRLGTEENTYENIELLQALLNLYSTFFNYSQENSQTTIQTNLTKQYILLATELILSILTIWSEYSAFTEVFISELCYKYCNSIRSRSAMLQLFSVILTSMNHNDKSLFNIALKTLTSSYKARKYERKTDLKPDPTAARERKPLPILKVHHQEEFFQDYLPQNQPLFEYMLDTFLEPKSKVFEKSLERFLRAIFLKTEFKYLKDLMSIFERKWKQFYENRQEFLGEDVSKLKTLGMMIQVLSKISASDEFKTYMIDKKITSDLIRILQIIEDEFHSRSMFKKLTGQRRILLQKLKEGIFDIFVNLCDHNIGIIKPDNSSQDYGHLLENIPSISEIQDLLKTLATELNTTNDLIEKLHKISGENGQQGNMERQIEDEDEDARISAEGIEASVEVLLKVLRIIENLGKNVVGQYILLNTEYSKIIRNPTPIIYFNDFYTSLIYLANQIVLTREGEVYSLSIAKIIKSFLYSVYLLCYNPLNNQILNSDKRKSALKMILLKNKPIQIPNLQTPLNLNGIGESLQALEEIVNNKKRDILHNRAELREQLTSSESLLTILDIIVFNIGFLNNFINSNSDHKKDNEKIYVDMDHPKEIEQKFKDVEEKEANKEVKLPFLDLRNTLNNNHKLSVQAMALVDHSLDDFFVKLNQPLLAWKKGRIHSIARDQLGLVENRITFFKYSHLNDFEVEHWDYDGCINFNKKRLEVALALSSGEAHQDKVEKQAFKRSAHIRRYLLDLFGAHSIFSGPETKSPFSNEIYYQLESSRAVSYDLDDKPLLAIKKKQLEIKHKTPISTESYFSPVQQTPQETFSKRFDASSKQPSTTLVKSSSSRPSSTHVDKFQDRKNVEKTETPQGPVTQSKGPMIGTLNTPTRSASIEVNQETPVRDDQQNKEGRLGTPINRDQGFAPQEFNVSPGMGNQNPQGMGQGLGEQGPFQRSPMNMQNIQPSIKTNMHPGGPISPMNMGPGGPGGMGNMQGGFNQQGGNFPGGQGNMGGMGYGMNMNQGNMMQNPNMGPGMGGPGPGMPFNNNMMNPSFPGMMHGGMGPNQGKMHGQGGYMGGPMNMQQQQQFQEQGGPMMHKGQGQGGQGQPQKISDLKHDLIAMIQRTKNPTPQQGQGFPQGEQMQQGGFQGKMGGGPMMGNEEMGMGQGMQREKEGDLGMHPQNQPFGGPMGGPQQMMMQQQPQTQYFPPMSQGGVQTLTPGQQEQKGQVGQGVQGAALTGINSLNPQERKLLKEIMENKNKRDPRCAQRIKEILIKHPRIKEFIMNQNKAQQQQPPS